MEVACQTINLNKELTIETGPTIETSPTIEKSPTIDSRSTKDELQNAEEADNESDNEKEEENCNSTRNSCSSGYESRAKTESNAAEKTREALILANMSTPNRKKFLRKRAMNTSRQLMMESNGNKISSKINLSSSSDVSPKSSPELKLLNNTDETIELKSLDKKDFTDVKQKLIQKGERNRWKRVIGTFVFILILSIVASCCFIFPLTQEVTPKTSFRKSHFYEHSEWFSLSYPNGAPPV